MKGKFRAVLNEYDKHVRRFAFWEQAIIFWGREIAKDLDDVGNAMYAQACRARDSERHKMSELRIILGKGVYRE